jgi:hypothetical protein
LKHAHRVHIFNCHFLHQLLNIILHSSQPASSTRVVSDLIRISSCCLGLLLLLLLVPMCLAVSSCNQTVDSACTGIYTYVSGADIRLRLSISWEGLQAAVVLTVISEKSAAYFPGSLAPDVFAHANLIVVNASRVCCWEISMLLLVSTSISSISFSTLLRSLIRT